MYLTTRIFLTNHDNNRNIKIKKKLRTVCNHYLFKSATKTNMKLHNEKLKNIAHLQKILCILESVSRFLKTSIAVILASWI